MKTASVRFLILTIFAGLLVSVGNTGAVLSARENFGALGVVNQGKRLENAASREAAQKSQGLNALIRRANNMIDSRINSLNTLSTRIQNDNRLTSEQKSNLLSQVQTSINGLMALKQKIDSDTDLNTARADAKQIVTNYYIYAIFEPKIRLLITLNNLSGLTSNLSAQLPKIQDLINSLKSQGKDTSGLQAVLNDVSSELQAINNDIGRNQTRVQSIPLNNVVEAETAFKEVRQDISSTVREGFAKIRSDFAQMRNLFKQIITINKPSTPSAATNSAD